MRGAHSAPAARRPAEAKLYDMTHKKVAVLPTREMQDEFAHLMHSIVLAFSRIRVEAGLRQEQMIGEWRVFRGLLTWSDERLELLETRVERAEGQIQSLASAAGIDVGKPPVELVDNLKKILANYASAREEMRRPTQQAYTHPDPAPMDAYVIAEAAGVSVATVQRYRKNRDRVTREKQTRIEKAIGRLTAKS